MMKVDDLKLDVQNARVRGDRAKSNLQKSIEKFGAARSVVIDGDGIVRAGNGTVEAAKAAGIKKVKVIKGKPDELVVVQREDMKGEAAKAYAIADNRSSELAEWDVGILGQQLGDLTEFDVEDLGFTESDLESLLPADDPVVEDIEPEIDRAEELREEWGTEEGQLWIIKGQQEHRLLCGDSTDLDSVLVLFGELLADGMVTDPPYGVSYVGKTKDALTVANDDLEESDLAVFVYDAFGVAEEVCRPGAYWYATVPPGPLHLIFASDWKNRGILRQIMVWVKDSMVLGHSEYHYRHEPILFGWKKGSRNSIVDRTRTTVFEFCRPKRSVDHPTMKPLDLWTNLIVDAIRKHERLFDPFSGSGTSFLACERSNRVCFGVELSPSYCAVILQRMKDAGCDCQLSGE